MRTTPPTAVPPVSVFTDGQVQDGLLRFSVTAPNFTPEEGVSYNLVRSFDGSDFNITPTSPNDNTIVSGEEGSTFRIDATCDVEVTSAVPVTTPGQISA